MKQICCTILLFFAFAGSHAQDFADYFQNKTLRVDYIFTGNAERQNIYLDELSQLPSWAGRQHRLSELPLEGNGQIIVKDLATQQTIYKTSFSSLFHEWLSTDEAKETAKGFENTFLLPFPKQPAEVEISLYSPRKEVMARYKHLVRPDDILIHQRGVSHVTPHRYLLRNGNEKDCIDVAILAEGYTDKEMDLFYQDAESACESLFSHEPFRSMKDKFNIVAVASPSTDSGVSVPRENQWKQTAVHSHFDTFYSDRYLTTSRIKSIHNALAGIPYEHIIILANTDVYGGGGIYNSYTLTTAHHPMFKPVILTSRNVEFDYTPDGTLANRTKFLVFVCFHAAIMGRAINTFGRVTSTFVYPDRELLPFVGRSRYRSACRKQIFPFGGKIHPC